MDPVQSVETSKSNYFNRVTPLSKILALTLFITLPIGAFFFGRYYEKSATSPTAIYKTQKTSAEVNTSITPGAKTTPRSAVDLKQQAYEEIYLLENQSSDSDTVEVKNVVGNFATGVVGYKSGGGATILWLKTDNAWKRLFTTQFAWSCKVLLDSKVPPSLFSSSGPESDCVFYSQDECKGYEKECASKDIKKDKFNYQDLYSLHFGQ